MGVHELWVGGTSDTYYQEKTGIFKVQEEFASVFDIVDEKIIPFCNIVDNDLLNLFQSCLACFLMNTYLEAHQNIFFNE